MIDDGIELFNRPPNVRKKMKRRGHSGAVGVPQCPAKMNNDQQLWPLSQSALTAEPAAWNVCVRASLRSLLLPDW